MARRPVDEKIVKLSMDNSDLVMKAAESSSLLTKFAGTLNKIPGVNLGKTTQELRSIGDATQNIPMNKLGNAVQSVTDRFSIMGIIGATAVSNITNRVVDMGIKLAKSLTIDQIGEGFREYELKMGSIRTIMANTEHEGTTLAQVKGSLEELNKYADLTIYNFGQMTDSIGRFTAAGVGIDDSTVAIKGMSNLAATSGATTHQLNSAMYQMSQALAAGRFNLMDWNSMVNSGMGGKITQDALVGTAREMGKAVDMSEGFRESIRDGWLDSEVFLATMKKFAEDESMLEAATKIRTFTQLIDTVQEAIGSGLGMTFEHIFGDFEEATELFSTIGEAMTAWIDDAMDGFNKSVGEIADGGGFLNIFKGLINILKPIGQLIGAIASGFSRAFSSVSTGGIVKVTEGFLKFTESLKMSDETVQKLSRIFELFFSGIKLGIDVIAALAGALMGLIPPGLFASFIDLTSSAVEFIFAIAGALGVLLEASGVLGFFKDGLSVAHTWIDKVASKIGEMTSKFEISGPAAAKALAMISTGVAGAITGVGKFTSEMLKSSPFEWMRKLGDTMNSLTIIFSHHYDKTSSVFKALFETVREYLKYLNINFSSFSSFVTGVVATVGNVLGPIWDLVKDIFSGLEFRHFLGGGFLVGVWGVVKKLIENMDNLDGVWSGIKDFIEVMKSNADKSSFLDGITESLTNFSDSLKSAISVGNIVAISVAIGILALSMKALEDLDTAQVTRGMAAIAGSMLTLSWGMKAMDGANIGGVGSIKLVAFAAAVKILTSTMKDVAELSANQIAKGAAALVVTMTTLATAMRVMNGIKVGTGPITMIAIAATVKILSSIVTDMVGIHRNHVIKGTGTIGILLAELVIFSKLMDGVKVKPSTAVSLLGVSASLMILVEVINQLAGIHSNKIVKGMGSIGILLAELSAFAYVMRGSSITVSDALGIAGVAGALLIIVEVINKLAVIHSNKIVKGMGSIAILLAEIALFAKVTKGQNMTGTAIGVAILAGALVLMVPPLQDLGEMRWKDLVKGLGTMAGALVAMALAAKLASGSIGGALAIGVMALSLDALIKPIKEMSDLPWLELINNLLKLGVAMGAMAGMSLLLAPAVLPMLAFSGAMVLFGASLTLIGGGLALFGTGLALLAGLTATSVASIITAVELLLDGLLGILGQLGLLLSGIIKVAADAIQDSAGEIADAVVSVILSILAAIDENLPEFIDRGASIVLSIMAGIEEHSEPLATAGADMIIALVNAATTTLDEKGPELREALGLFVGELLLFLVDSGLELAGILLGWIPGVDGALTTMGESMTTAIREAFGLEEEIDNEIQRGGNTIDGHRPGVSRKTGRIGKESADEFNRQYIIDKYGEEKGGALIRAIDSGQLGVTRSGAALGRSGSNGVRSVDWAPAGTSLVSGLEKGIRSRGGRGSSLWNTAWNIGKSALSAVKQALDSRSPSKETTKEGENFGQGLANGINSMVSRVGDSAKGLATKALDTTNVLLDTMAADLEREVQVKLVLDSSAVDSWTPTDLDLLQPDTRFTNRMVTESQPVRSQNEDIINRNNEVPVPGDEYNYDVHIHATGDLPRATIRKMAQDFKQEIETIDRRDRINRGEEVVYT